MNFSYPNLTLDKFNIDLVRWKAPSRAIRKVRKSGSEGQKTMKLIQIGRGMQEDGSEEAKATADGKTATGE